jgi:hypothetical protein
MDFLLKRFNINGVLGTYATSKDLKGVEFKLVVDHSKLLVGYGLARLATFKSLGSLKKTKT